MELFGQLKNRLFNSFILNHYRSCLSAVMIFIISTLVSCKNEPVTDSQRPLPEQSLVRIAAPSFNADSAYSFIQKQVDFGPRIPGTTAHSACATYLIDRLKSYGFETQVQKGTVETFDGKKFSLKNIIASFKPEVKSRILVCSHWDTRPWADDESDEAYASKPFDGANDGASGVGVAIEIARQLQAKSPNIGVDIIFFDLEDYGDPEGDSKFWCLGSQYWAQNLHKPDYYANFGILLDMVGNADAIFPKEEQSVSFASGIVDKIWKAAEEAGYQSYFDPVVRSHVGTDDHIFVNQDGVPCVDIIEYDPKTEGFGEYHHTRKDNMQIIDRATLKAVGQTLLEVIYNEK